MKSTEQKVLRFIDENKLLFKKDKILDKINAGSFAIIEEEIKKDISIIDQTLLLFAIVKKFEINNETVYSIVKDNKNAYALQIEWK